MQLLWCRADGTSLQQAPLSLQKSMEVLARLRAPSGGSSSRDAALWLQLTASGATPHADDPLDQASLPPSSPDGHFARSTSPGMKPHSPFPEGLQPPKTPKRSESPTKVGCLLCTCWLLPHYACTGYGAGNVHMIGSNLHSLGNHPSILQPQGDFCKSPYLSKRTCVLTGCDCSALLHCHTSNTASHLPQPACGGHMLASKR